MRETKRRAFWSLFILSSLTVALLFSGVWLGWVRFENSFQMGDVLSLVGLVGVGVGLYFSYLQLQLTARQLRGSFVVESSSRILDDPDLSDLFYRIDHGQFVYDSGFVNSADEKAIDRLLFHFDQLAALVEMQAIEFADLKMLEYSYVRVYQNEHVKRYLDYLDGLTSAVGAEASFPRFRRIALRMLEGQVLREKAGGITTQSSGKADPERSP